jgi:hypothetical protein
LKESTGIKEQHFGAVVGFVDKDKEIAGSGVLSKLVLDDGAKAIVPKAHVGWDASEENANAVGEH